MLIQEVVSNDAVSVSKDDTLRTVVSKMVLNNCASVTVVDGEQNLIGVVTIRDVMMPLYPKQGDYVHDSLGARDFEGMEEGYAKVLEKTAGDVMTANPVAVSTTDPVLKALSFMGLRNLRRIPVVDGSKLIGVVTIEAINGAMFIHHG
ncbi:MAG TPA: CBS domain-containing protein [Ghiorsea sp.]|nr:CBS domain-containing protein [Ghiorsea sp.]HIP07195.1 CBS domain-containing protein [Mariprofundaceae bacterium]